VADIPAGHPVDTMLNENKELNKVVKQAEEILEQLDKTDDKYIPSLKLKLSSLLN
jgi:DUF438 domain-containing protein